MSKPSKEKIRVLIVDDEPNIITSINYFLKQEGYEVASATNGLMAVEAYRNYNPDIILLDVMMPEMDGFETARRIRMLDRSSKTAIIFLTAKGTAQDRRTGYMSGADDYIVKPFDNEVILQKISEILE